MEAVPHPVKLIACTSQCWMLRPNPARLAINYWAGERQDILLLSAFPSLFQSGSGLCVAGVRGARGLGKFLQTVSPRTAQLPLPGDALPARNAIGKALVKSASSRARELFDERTSRWEFIIQILSFNPNSHDFSSSNGCRLAQKQTNDSIANKLTNKLTNKRSR